MEPLCELSDFKEISDDEVFFGKLSLKEIKISLGLPKDLVCKRQQEFSRSIEDVNTNALSAILEKSLIPNQTQSQPNLRPNTIDLSSPISSDSPLIKTTDESFMAMEDLVTKLCLSPHTSDNCELNDTCEIVNYILHGASKTDSRYGSQDIEQESPDNSPSRDLKKDGTPEKPAKDNSNLHTSPENSNLEPRSRDLKKDGTPEKPVKDNSNLHSSPENSNLEPGSQVYKPNSPDYHTPAKFEFKIDTATPQFKTPIGRLELPTSAKNTPVFKTPSCRSVLKKPITPRNTRPTTYDHVASPIANYIRNSPRVPLVRQVEPKRPLPGISAIPKPVKHTEVKSQKNKENEDLPFAAYKSAKKTKVIQLPENKLPQGQWAKKLTSSVPKVMKHENRQMNPIKKPLTSNLEDSMVNLSCHQAEVSLCTQKSAFKSVNKNKH